MIGVSQADSDQYNAQRFTLLVALQPRSYSEVIGYTIRVMCLYLKVEVVESDPLHQVVQRMTPHLILCSQPKPAILNGQYPWIEYLPYDEPTALRIDGQRREMGRSIELNDLLEVIDELCRRASG